MKVPQNKLNLTYSVIVLTYNIISLDIMILYDHICFYHVSYLLTHDFKDTYYFDSGNCIILYTRVFSCILNLTNITNKNIIVVINIFIKYRTLTSKLIIMSESDFNLRATIRG